MLKIGWCTYSQMISCFYTNSRTFVFVWIHSHKIILDRYNYYIIVFPSLFLLTQAITYYSRAYEWKPTDVYSLVNRAVTRVTYFCCYSNYFYFPNIRFSLLFISKKNRPPYSYLNPFLLIKFKLFSSAPSYSRDKSMYLLIIFHIINFKNFAFKVRFL